MFRDSHSSDENLAKLIVMRLVQKCPGLSGTTVTPPVETTSIANDLMELRAVLKLHLQIAKVRVELEESTLGASETMVKALANLVTVAKLSRETEEIARKADALIKAMRFAEHKGLLSELCEKAGQRNVPQSIEEGPKKSFFDR